MRRVLVWIIVLTLVWFAYREYRIASHIGIAGQPPASQRSFPAPVVNETEKKQYDECVEKAKRENALPPASINALKQLVVSLCGPAPMPKQ